LISLLLLLLLLLLYLIPVCGWQEISGVPLFSKKKKQSKLKTAKQGTEGSGLVNYLVLLSISLSRWAKEGVQTDKQQKDLIQQ
jgi:hypothetical protein